MTNATTLPVTPAEARALLAAAGSGEVISLRRAIDPQPVLTTIKRDVPPGQGGEAFCKGWRWNGQWVAELGEAKFLAACPWKVGDVLDVLEPFATSAPTKFNRVVGIGENATETTTFAEAVHTFTARQADGWEGPPPKQCGAEWMPAEQMPREFARLTLTVTAAAVARSDAAAWEWEVSGVPAMKGLER